MKKGILLLSIGFLLLGSFVTYGVIPKILNLKDTEVKMFGVYLNMGQNDVEELLGEPKRIVHEYQGVFDANVLTY